jgi:hypothetical protein
MARSAGARAPRPVRWRGPSIRARGPRYLQGVLLSQAKDTANIPRPEKYLGTRVDGPSLRRIIAAPDEAEWRVFWALVTFELLPDYPNGFSYQVPFGGGHTAGGTVPDFLINNVDLAFWVQGTHFHYVDAATRANNTIVKLQLAARGVTSIDIDEEDAMQRPRAVVAAGLRGESWARSTRGG